jgi:hypothetical protein
VRSKTLTYLIVKIYCNELYHGYNFSDLIFWFSINEQIDHGYGRDYAYEVVAEVRA